MSATKLVGCSAVLGLLFVLVSPSSSLPTQTAAGRDGNFQEFREGNNGDGDDSVIRHLDSIGGGHVLRNLDVLGGANLLRQTRGGLDSLSGNTFGTQKRYDSLRGDTFGSQKRNFDEIDRSGFNSFVKKNFDEIDRSGFDSFVKKNFDEIDRSGFNSFVKKNTPWLLSRYYSKDLH